MTVTFYYTNKPAFTVVIEDEAQLARFLLRYSPDKTCIGYTVMTHRIT